MSRIRRVVLHRIYDSRGQPTVEARVETEAGAVGTAGAPSGASTGTHEVRAFPEGGVEVALQRFTQELAPRLEGLAVRELGDVDRLLHELDGTARFERIGGNTATACSVAAALALANERGVPLWKVLGLEELPDDDWPAIVGNCLNGGRHAIGGPDMQEFHAVAYGEPADAIRAALAVHRRVGERLHERFPRLALGRGDEGGWVAPVSNVEALELLSSACAEVRDHLKLRVQPGLDLAANEFYRDGKYRYRDQTVDADGQLRFLQHLIDRFGLAYVEDPFAEEEFSSFAALTESCGSRCWIVGDDLYTTDRRRLRRGIERRSTNAVLIKVNQVGTISDALATVADARSAGWRTVASHRSGEVADGWLAQFAVGVRAAGLKCGLLGGERVAKLNELLGLARAAGA